jgi:pullulanase/glycogen debranching enzyme
LLEQHHHSRPRLSPLGATPGPQGTNFAVSSHGDEVRLCLFGGDGSEMQFLLPERDGGVWHGFAPGVTPGKPTVTESAAAGFRKHDSRARLRCTVPGRGSL